MPVVDGRVLPCGSVRGRQANPKMVVKSGDPGGKATVADEGAFVTARGDLQRSGLLVTVDEDLVEFGAPGSWGGNPAAADVLVPVVEPLAVDAGRGGDLQAWCRRAAGQFLGWCEARGLRIEAGLATPRRRPHPGPRVAPER